MYVVEKVLNGKLLEYCYFLHKEDEKESVCIDPGYDSDKILNYIEKKGLVVDTILLTHGHFDHILGARAIIDKFSPKVYISEEDEKILYDPYNNYADMIKVYDIPKIDITKNVHDEDIIEALGLSIKCLSTPGHTSGCISYYIESEKILFSGDTLFKETFGRVDLYSGDFATIQNSILHKLFLLPDDTKVYPGHGRETTIGYEKIHNEIL